MPGDDHKMVAIIIFVCLLGSVLLIVPIVLPPNHRHGALAPFRFPRPGASRHSHGKNRIL